MKKISIVWSTDDVLLRAQDLGIVITEYEAELILDDILRHHDADVGINWGVIDYYINELDGNVKFVKLNNDLYERSSE